MPEFNSLRNRHACPTGKAFLRNFTNGSISPSRGLTAGRVHASGICPRHTGEGKHEVTSTSPSAQRASVYAAPLKGFPSQSEVVVEIIVHSAMGRKFGATPEAQASRIFPGKHRSVAPARPDLPHRRADLAARHGGEPAPPGDAPPSRGPTPPRRGVLAERRPDATSHREGAADHGSEVTGPSPRTETRPVNCRGEQ